MTTSPVTRNDGRRREMESIMLATYPECKPSYMNEKMEESMQLAMTAIKACRSLRSSHNIANKVLVMLYKNIDSSATEDVIRIQTDNIMTLNEVSLVEINCDETHIPKSVGIFVVYVTLTMLMDLTGLVDFDAKIKTGKDVVENVTIGGDS